MNPVTFTRTVSILMPDETLVEIDLTFTANYESGVRESREEAPDQGGWEITDVSLSEDS